MTDPKHDDLRERLRHELEVKWNWLPLRGPFTYARCDALVDWLVPIIEQWYGDAGWLSPEQAHELQAERDRWHESADHYAAMWAEQAKPLPCGHAKDTCSDCEHIHQAAEKCDVPCWDYGKSGFRPCFCPIFKCRACVEVERRIREASKALQKALGFIESVKLIQDTEFDAHGVKWPSSRYHVDVKKQREVIEEISAITAELEHAQGGLG